MYPDLLVQVMTPDLSPVNPHFSRFPARDQRKQHLESWPQKICSREPRWESGSGEREWEGAGLNPQCWWGGPNEADREKTGYRDLQQNSGGCPDACSLGYLRSAVRACVFWRVETS